MPKLGHYFREILYYLCHKHVHVCMTVYTRKTNQFAYLVSLIWSLTCACTMNTLRVTSLELTCCCQNYNEISLHIFISLWILMLLRRLYHAHKGWKNDNCKHQWICARYVHVLISDTPCITQNGSRCSHITHAYLNNLHTQNWMLVRSCTCTTDHCHPVRTLNTG